MAEVHEDRKATFTFIKEVYNSPVVWDVSSPSYKDTSQKQKMMEQIAKKLNLKGELHSGSETFTPDRATVHDAVASLSTETICTSVGPNATTQPDSLPPFPASAASQLEALTLEEENLQQEVELAQLARQQRDNDREVLHARQVPFSSSKESKLDALTLEAQHLKKEIYEAQLVQQQRKKEQEVLRLLQELSALRRENSGADRPRPEAKAPPAPSLVLDDLRKTGSLSKKVDKKLSTLGLTAAGPGYSSGEDDEHSSDGEDSDVVRKQRDCVDPDLSDRNDLEIFQDIGHNGTRDHIHQSSSVERGVQLPLCTDCLHLAPPDRVSVSGQCVSTDSEQGSSNASSSNVCSQLQDYLLALHEEVYRSGLPNYSSCRCSVLTNLNIPAWRECLQNYPDRIVCDYLQYGWPVNYDYARFNFPVSDQRTHKGALDFPDAVTRYLDSEIACGAVGGPFDTIPFSSGKMAFSPLNSVPKSDRTTPNNS
ncbi:hypothetical protein ACROYT_G014129 [Oculina patagonica]